MKIQRALYEEIKKTLENTHKSVVLYGARQVGKTTLISDILKNSGWKYLSVNGDIVKSAEVFSSRNIQKIEAFISGYEVLFIDEAQRIPDIGINLKIIIDNFPKIKVIATGSSSFELANKINEPLTGRVRNFIMYPISFLELKSHYNNHEIHEILSQRLIYGSYPEIFHFKNNKEKSIYLAELSNAYLYKDVLEIGNIKHSLKIRKLLQLLAFQIGSEVSLTELGNTLDISKNTVAHYIDLLEKSFVVFRLSGFSRNLRKEVSKMDKIYFYDLGIRNVLINNLNDPEDRDDMGKIWENFLIIERLKYLKYTQTLSSSYYWRTYTGAELDYIEERDGKLYGYEIKYGRKKPKQPKSWLEINKNSEYSLINRENYLEFIGIDT